ncbi:CBS domain-containing protein [Catenulispora subtropica]|uniref:CBS domain-containing protein n=1 Tax=Catenulispora subtropica TaxID=450798 RepID=A0ABP5E151_9ACTN
MEHRKVSSVMTPAERVISVPADAGYKDITALLAEHRISAVPVLDTQGRVIGVVSEDDLMAKESHLEGPVEDSRGFAFAGHAERRAQRKAAATTAHELMTAPPVTTSMDQDVVQAARKMAERHVKRLIVTDSDGGLRGVVSRRDILKVFARSDEDIHREIANDVIRDMFWIDPATIGITVEDGIVHLRGHLENWGQGELMCGMVRRTDGVVAVVNHIDFDSGPRETPRRIGRLGIFQRPTA